MKQNSPSFLLGEAEVTLLRKILPLSNRGVFRFLPVIKNPAAAALSAAEAFFFRIELLLPPFRPVVLAAAPGPASLQHRMIFSNKKTWYSLSTSPFVTGKTSSKSREPKLERWWPFQSSTRCSNALTVCSFSALRWASLIRSVMRFADARPSWSSP